MKRALVTGAAGFVGRWLCAALLRDGWSVVGAVPPSASARETARKHADGAWGTLASVEWRTGDIRDGAYLHELVDFARPDAVVHLAAISHLQHASNSVPQAWEVNLQAPVRLLHELALRRERDGSDPLVLLAGSAEQYGRHPQDAMPLDESTLQAPLTVYGATKAAQEIAGLQAFRSRGLRVIAARAFPHSGPGQETRFVIPALVARALALKSDGTGAPMLVGNLAPVRDFLHVSDVVAAYIALLERGRPGTAYNVASGTGRSVQDVAERVLARVGVEAPLAEDPALVRNVDVPVLIGDATRLTTDTGWRPLRQFDDILDDLLADHRRHAATR